MSLYEKTKKLINSEIKEENEPKETAVMIRVLCLVDFAFLLINAGIIAGIYGAKLGLMTLGSALIMFCVLLLSFRIKMTHLLLCYYVALVFNISMLVLSFGLSFMFQAQLYTTFMIFFYRGAGSKKEHVLSVLFSVAIVLGLIFHVGARGHWIEVEAYSNAFVTLLCTLYVIAKSLTIALFFRIKFSASEAKIIRYSKKLEMLATTDPLTKLQNRRGMLNHISELSNTLMDSKGGLLTIAIGDIDFFKHINDTYGHDAGDYVLETLAKIMNEFMDGKGMVARWGGEEFLFSLEGINGDYAFEEISKLLHLIERYEFSFDGTPIKVTMTFGLEEYDENIGVDKVITKADEKLYMGKEQGRNRVIY